jgi:hypothetical protein
MLVLSVELEIVDADVVGRFLLFILDGGDGQPEGMEDAPLFGRVSLI